MIRDYDELISYIVFRLINADIAFEQKKDTITKYKLRYYAYKFAIKTWLSNTKSIGLNKVSQKYINQIYQVEDKTIDVTGIIENAGLTPKEREIIQLYFYENYSMPEIGELQKVSKQAIYARLENALKKMRKVIGVNNEYEGGTGR